MNGKNDSAYGWGVCYSYSRFFEIGFVNGDAEGYGMYYWPDSGECEIYAEDGSLVDIYSYKGETYPIMIELENGGAYVSHGVGGMIDFME